MRGIQFENQSDEYEVRFQNGGLAWHVGFRHTPASIPAGSVDVEIKPVSTPNGIYIVRRLLLHPKLRQHRIMEIQVEVYTLRKFKEILKAEMKRLGYIEGSYDLSVEAVYEIGSCRNSLNRVSWLLQQEERENPEIREKIEICKNDLEILMISIREVKNHE